MDIPVLDIAGWSGAGKTTFIEGLIPELKALGLRLSVIKSDGHGFDMDREGKDTWRFSAAGADCVAITDGRRAVLLENRPVDLYALLSRLRDVDLVIAEGFHSLSLPRIEVFRGDGRGYRSAEPEKLLAVVGARAPEGVPLLSPEDASGAARLIVKRLGLTPGGKK